MLFEVVFEL